MTPRFSSSSSSPPTHKKIKLDYEYPQYSGIIRHRDVGIADTD